MTVQEGTGGESGWRLVCHTCGEQYPKNMALNPVLADCCLSPRLHVHGLKYPCNHCADAEHPKRIRPATALHAKISYRWPA